MTKEEIQELIGRLKADAGDDAYFGIFKYGSTSDESFIKANKSGLKLFGSQILEAIHEVDHTVFDETKNVIFLDYNWTDEDSDTCIQYIEPVVHGTNRKNIINEPEGSKDKVLKYGCVIGLIFLLIAALTGIVTILKWIF